MMDANKRPAENRGAFCVLNIVVRTIASISFATACLIVNIGLIIMRRNEAFRQPLASAELLFHFHAGHLEAGLEHVFTALAHLVTEAEIKKLGRQRRIEEQVRQTVGAGDLLDLAHLKQKSPAENRGAFDLNIVMRIEAFRPWQTWQRPTLPSLET